MIPDVETMRATVHQTQQDALTLLEQAHDTIEKTWAVGRLLDREGMVRTVQLHAELIGNMIDLTNWLSRHEDVLNGAIAADAGAVRLPVGWNFVEERARALAAQLPDLCTLIARAEDLFARARQLNDVLHGETVH